MGCCVARSVLIGCVPSFFTNFSLRSIYIIHYSPKSVLSAQQYRIPRKFESAFGSMKDLRAFFAPKPAAKTQAPKDTKTKSPNDKPKPEPPKKTDSKKNVIASDDDDFVSLPPKKDTTKQKKSEESVKVNGEKGTKAKSPAEKEKTTKSKSPAGKDVEKNNKKAPERSPATRSKSKSDLSEDSVDEKVDVVKKRKKPAAIISDSEEEEIAEKENKISLSKKQTKSSPSPAKLKPKPSPESQSSDDDADTETAKQTIRKKTPEKERDKKTPEKSKKTPEKEVEKKTPEVKEKKLEKKTPEKKTPEKITPMEVEETKSSEKVKPAEKIIKTPEEKKVKTEEKTKEKKKRPVDDDDDAEMTEVDEDLEWMNKKEEKAIKKEEKEKTSKRKVSSISDSPVATSKKPRLDFEPSPSKPKQEVKTEKLKLDFESSSSSSKPKPKPDVDLPKTEVSKLAKSTPTTDSPSKPKGNANWRSYAARPPPANKGMKALPVGEPNCLAGKTFIVSGVLDSLERDEVHDLIKSYGGHPAKSVTKACTHAVIGLEPGEKKLAEINNRGLKILNEDELFELIRTSKGQKVVNKKLPRLSVSPAKKPATQPASSRLNNNNNDNSNNNSNNNNNNNNNNATQSTNVESQLWVDKYKPTRIGDLAGNPTAIKTLQDWLAKWDPNAKEERAALLSGPPGIGKTSSANIVAKAQGYECVEFNASDQRNKKHLEGFFAGIAGSKSIGGFFAPVNSSSSSSSSTMGMGPNPTKKICIIMDEVDGMSGQADRSGVGELIKVIQKTKTPIICICNDIHNTRIKSLVKYCKDIRFQRPGVKSIQPRVTAIARQEDRRLQIDDLAIEKVVEAAHGDLRQALTILHMWSRSAKKDRIDHFQAKQKLQAAGKDMTISPFEATRSLLTGQGITNLSSRLDMYFVDYGIMNLFLQENYINNRPFPHGDLKSIDMLESACKAAEFISDGDVVDKVIRSSMRWDLLNTHGMLSTVAPSYYMQGTMQMPFFPGWLGKNSTAVRRNRQLSELQMHMRTAASADKSQVMLDYVPAFQIALTKPLIDRGSEAIDEVIEMMDSYCITRDDRDALLELAPDSCEPLLRQIPPALKTAFTRRYNEEGHMAQVGAVMSKMASKSGGGSREYEEEEPAFIESEQNNQEDEEEEEDDMKTDKFIKEVKPKAKGKGKGKATGAKKAGATKAKKASAPKTKKK